PVGKTDTTLPFFKQYFGGGANSMRGWPIRGIGPGAKPLAPYNSFALNDRTGDVRFEINGEYRYDIAQIIPNSLALKGALFIDAGNVWNFRNTLPGGGNDSLQFKLKDVYKQLGVDIGTGFRFDFNYFLIRFDLGFRFKRPDIQENNGWQIPNITYNNLFRKGEPVPDPAHPGETISDNRYRIWRYQNFNFTIGLSYPF
ncbi:MAG: BamA/TamA family outer membrane protein, partial [Ferruginibacter sp.]